MALQTDPFLTLLEAEFSRLTRDPLVENLHQKAWQQFLQLGLPQKKDAFQYVPLRELYAEKYTAPHTRALPSKEEILRSVLPECAASYLVFVDGIYSAELSAAPAGLIILPFTKALRSYQTLLQSRLENTKSEEKDAFALLNLAFASGESGSFIYLPPKKRLDAPLQCLHLSHQKGAISSPRVHLFVGREASLKIVSTFEPKESSWINSVLDVTLEEGARIEQASTLFSESKSWVFDSIRATLKRDSYFEAVGISRGAKSHRQNFKVALNGENAEASLSGTWLLRSDFSSHAHVLIEHNAPHTRSKQLFKGVIDEISQSSFEGKIFVRPEAQKTEAYQLNNNLILGARAQAFSKPNLEIFADDVKASHGATVGQLDSAALFYLKTRGIPEAVASRLLVRAFSQEVGAKLPLTSLREQFTQEVESYL